MRPQGFLLFSNEHSVPKTVEEEDLELDSIYETSPVEIVREDNSMTSRFTLCSTFCFTIMTTLHGTGKFTYCLFVIIAQSSATRVLHIFAGCYSCPQCPARAWKQP